MSLISTLKSLLGLDSKQRTRERDTSVTVEEPIAEETDAAASTESLVEDSVEDGDADSPAEAAEPAEAAGPSEADRETDVEDVDPDADAEDVADTEGAEDVEIVKGVGPAYAERLHEAGVETVADLVAADAAELGDATGISPKRIGRWQESAADRTE